MLWQRWRGDETVQHSALWSAFLVAVVMSNEFFCILIVEYCDHVFGSDENNDGQFLQDEFEVVVMSSTWYALSFGHAFSEIV